ncbi:MAG TPA: alpha-glucan family phosphorylase, partial [Nitrospiria bacterium]
NLTYIALNLSRYVNGVAKRHGEISRLQFATYDIDSITNGIHVGTWVSPAFRKLFDRHIMDWKTDNFSLRYAIAIRDEEVWEAHVEAKKTFIDFVNEKTGAGFDPETFTIGFARRVTSYKRSDLFLEDLERLKRMASSVGPLQLAWAGKAHPRDEPGKEMIRRIIRSTGELGDRIKLAYVEGYDMRVGGLMTAGVDLWLNNPEPPLEASGTSGMKAALNGVPSLSVPDGWWIEGCIEGVTGWSIGEFEQEGGSRRPDRSSDAAKLYDKLEKVVIPMFYGNRERYIRVMRNAIALNGSFFNTHRMLKQYVVRAYL